MNEKTTRRQHGVLLTAGVVLLAIGIVCFMMQTMSGLVVSDIYPFGVYLAGFFCFVGSACGLLLVAVAAEFGTLPKISPTRPLYMGALVLLVVSGLTITFLDSGEPLRVFSMITGTNPTSMVSWDFYLLALTTIVTLICAIKPGKTLSVIGAMLALGIVVVESMILIVTSGVPHWNNPMLVVVFLADALALGIGLAMLYGHASDRRLQVVLATVLALTAIMLLADMAMGAYTSDAAMLALMGGQFAPLYWTMLAGGILVPLVMLARGTAPRVAATLAVVGVVLDKFTLILAGEAITATGAVEAYAPSAVEFGCLAGMVGLGIVAFELFGRRWCDAGAADVAQDVATAVEGTGTQAAVR